MMTVMTMMMMVIPLFFVSLILVASIVPETTWAFSVGRHPAIRLTPRTTSTHTTTSTTTASNPTPSSRLFSSSSSSVDQTQQEQQQMLKISLEKPLGMILEEVVENSPRGVYVKELAAMEDGGGGGSAGQSEWKDQLPGLPLATVQGQDVTTLDFDSVMQALREAPSPVTLEFIMGSSSEGGKDADDTDADTDNPPADNYEVGTTVNIKVLDDNNNQETLISAQVGDNLRQVLLENNIEVYKGLKQKLGNCGGGGQCGFCVADFVETEGWEERSDYESQKLNKQPPTARLTCLNNIQGPATIRIL